MRKLEQTVGAIVGFVCIGAIGPAIAATYSLPLFQNAFNPTSGPSGIGQVIYDDTLLKTGPPNISLTTANGGIVALTMDFPAGSVAFGGAVVSVPAESFTHQGQVFPGLEIRLQFYNNDPYWPAYMDGALISTTGDAEYRLGCTGGCVLYRVPGVPGSGSFAFGKAVPLTTDVPTLSQWGLVLMSFLLGLVGVAIMGRARRRALHTVRMSRE